MSEIHNRLTRLLPDLAVEESFLGHLIVSDLNRSDTAMYALADRLERGDAALLAAYEAGRRDGHCCDADEEHTNDPQYAALYAVVDASERARDAAVAAVEGMRVDWSWRHVDGWTASSQPESVARHEVARFPHVRTLVRRRVTPWEALDPDADGGDR